MPNRSARSAFVLPIVMICVVLLGLAAYGLSDQLSGELRVSTVRARLDETRRVAESGLEYAALLATEARHRPLRMTPLNDDMASLVWDSDDVSRTVFLTEPQRGESRTARPGLSDESARLHLGILPLALEDQEIARSMLRSLPEMTVQTADAILDWLDDDDVPRAFGAERSFYQAQGRRALPRNAVPLSVDELLNVRGVTAELFYGRSNSRTGAAGGWRDLLTVHSAKYQLDPRGRSRIFLNQENLVTLYDQVERELGPASARFIVALRLAGPLSRDESLPPQSSEPDDRHKVDARARSAEERAKRQLAAGGGLPPGLTPGAERGGIDLSQSPTYRLRSLVDLVGSAVRLNVNGTDSLLESPWSGEPTQLHRALSELTQRLTVTDAPALPGQISVNTASVAVLRAVPGLNKQTATAIVRIQERIARATPEEYSARYSSLAWLVREGVLNVRELRKAAPWLITQGDVFHVEVFATTTDFPAGVSVVALIDGSRPQVTISEIRECEPRTPVATNRRLHR